MVVIVVVVAAKVTAACAGDALSLNSQLLE